MNSLSEWCRDIKLLVTRGVDKDPPSQEEDERETGNIYKGSQMSVEADHEFCRSGKPESIKEDNTATLKTYDVSYSQITNDIILLVPVDDGETVIKMSPEAAEALIYDISEALDLHYELLPSPLGPIEEGESPSEETTD